MNIIDLQVVYGKKREIHGILGRGEAIRLAGEEFKPYFYLMSRSRPELPSYAELEDTDMIPLVFDSTRGGYVWAKDLSVYRVYVQSPSQVKKLVSGIRHPMRYGGIVKFDVRAAFDLVDSFFTEKDPLLSGEDLAEAMIRAAEAVSRHTVLSLDLEVESRGSYFPTPGRSRVLSASISVARISDAQGLSLENAIENTEIIYGDTSEEVIDTLMEMIRKTAPDFVVGYNSSAFDLRFIKYYRGDWGSDRYIPSDAGMHTHIDLFMLVTSMRSALGIRSTTAYSLDEVARELGILRPGTDIYRLERTATPEQIMRWYDGNRAAYELYSKADSAMALLIASQWIPVLAGVSSISKIPISRIQDLPSAGSIVEYMFIRYLENLDPPVATEYRSREWDYGKAPKSPGLDEVHYMGKVISAPPGIYRNILVFDFDQLYPTIYTFFQVDPITSFISKKPVHPGSMKIYVTRGGGGYTMYFNPVPGPISIVLTQLYQARKKVKEMSKTNQTAKLADKALKIISNSAYGALSKDAGNLLNEFGSAYIYYKSNEILVRAREAVEKLGLRVVYGDTDSIFIEVPEYASRGDMLDSIVEDVVSSIRRAIGEAFSIKLEGFYSTMIISTRKRGGGESKKTYVLIGDDKVVLKGIFYKHELPEVLDINREEVVRMLINGVDPAEIVDRYVSNLDAMEAIKALSLRKSMKLELVSEETGRLKLLNKPSHYAMIYVLCSMGICEKRGSSYFLPYPLPIENTVLSIRYIPITPRDLIVVGETITRVSVRNVERVEDERRGYIVSYSEKQVDLETAYRIARSVAIKMLEDLASIIPHRRASQNRSSLLPQPLSQLSE